MSSGMLMHKSLNHMQMMHIRSISKSKQPQINQVDDEVEVEVDDEDEVEIQVMINGKN
jgi:hypothetical protein